MQLTTLYLQRKTASHRLVGLAACLALNRLLVEPIQFQVRLYLRSQILESTTIYNGGATGVSVNPRYSNEIDSGCC